jgi:hypothetical protein
VEAEPVVRHKAGRRSAAPSLPSASHMTEAPNPPSPLRLENRADLTSMSDSRLPHRPIPPIIG